ncbi:MAG: helicase, partial [Neobacillus sp.]|nr:helicase [Neobacillus sp.]
IYFDFIFKDLFNTYFGKSNKTNVEPCLKSTSIFGMLTAYRLFYVGCSRARKELTVVVDADKIVNFKDEFKVKMNSVGFDIV